jgi:hypothetical protein
MSIASTRYATDEDIALRASADFQLLCPKDQKIAYGTDGAFLPSNSWTLSSVSVDFQAVGAAPGQVVHLELPGSGLRPVGECFVVVASVPGAITLRRKGQLLGVGMPPSPAAGMTGVEFAILSYSPQIALATDDLNRRFGIAAGSNVGRCASQLADPGELRDAVVLTVLYRRYLDASRDVGGTIDTFAAKAHALRAELDDLLARLTLHWSRSFADDAPGPTTRFSTRMSR